MRRMFLLFNSEKKKKKPPTGTALKANLRTPRQCPPSGPLWTWDRGCRTHSRGRRKSGWKQGTGHTQRRPLSAPAGTCLGNQCDAPESRSLGTSTMCCRCSQSWADPCKNKQNSISFRNILKLLGKCLKEKRRKIQKGEITLGYEGMTFIGKKKTNMFARSTKL